MIGIVGAGPAGSFCASLLGQAGFQVHLFDRKGIWEKPCGGGVTQKAVERYPFLKDSLEIKQLISSLEMISAANLRARVKLKEPLLLYSRKTLNGLLLDQAQKTGVNFHPLPVQEFKPAPHGWDLLAGEQKFSLDFLVGADGVNSMVRNRLTDRFAAEDLVTTYGYRIPGNGVSAATIKFFADFPGYAWIFPRPGQLSIGIGAKLGRKTATELKQNLNDFAASFFDKTALTGCSRPEKRGPSLASATAPLGNATEIYSALIPSLSARTLRRNRIAGPGWALVGDAAGFADPITSEGIYYALRSGELLAESIIQGIPESYPRCCDLDFVRDFIHAAEMSETFYLGKVGWTDWLTLMVRATSRSMTLQAMMNSLMAGRQDYATLVPRLLRLLPRILRELAVFSKGGGSLGESGINY